MATFKRVNTLQMRQKLGELTLLLKDLGRGTTRPLIHNIEIISLEGHKNTKTYIGIVDTGCDITRICTSIQKELVVQYKLGDNNQTYIDLKLRITELFGEEPIELRGQPYPITSNNPNEIKPDILLGRDFLKRCKMTYNGLSNEVIIEGYSDMIS